MKKNVIEESILLPNPMIGFGVPSMPSQRVIHRSLPEKARGRPYFYYKNTPSHQRGFGPPSHGSSMTSSLNSWIQSSSVFCACARKRGHIHNLPIVNRYEGDPPEEVRRDVLEQCMKWNLMWVGRNKLAPLECDEVEMLLGFPKNHTRGGGISRTDRYKSLGNSFQVYTVAYHLSVLKDIFPNGVNVLSLFSGIGEVALRRLGIKLKNVVSIEKSKVNRDIVRSWWEQTNQTGNLIHFDDVQQFDDNTIKHLIDSIGGFDLVVGGSPCNNLAGSNRVSRDGLEGTESSLFYDYFRILAAVKDCMRSREM